MGASGLLEPAVTFVAVYGLSQAWGEPTLTSLLLAALSVSTSPAAVMCVVNEQHSSGQVTKRLIPLFGITHTFRLSPSLAALAFGLVAGHRRIVLTQTQRNFGALGDQLAVALFTYTATTLEWHSISSFNVHSTQQAGEAVATTVRAR